MWKNNPTGVFQDWNPDLEGRRVNVFPEGGWPDFESADPYARPERIGTVYASQRWRRHLVVNFPTPTFEGHREPTAAFLWRRWHEGHPDRPLERIDIERFVEHAPAPGGEAHVTRDTLLSFWGRP